MLQSYAFSKKGETIQWTVSPLVYVFLHGFVFSAQNFLYSTRQAFSTQSTDTPVSAKTAAHMDA